MKIHYPERKPDYFLQDCHTPCWHFTIKKYFLTNKSIHSLVSHLSWCLIVISVFLFDFFIIKSIVESFKSSFPYYAVVKNSFPVDMAQDRETDNNSFQNAIVREIIPASDTSIQKMDLFSGKVKPVSLSELKKLLVIKSCSYHQPAVSDKTGNYKLIIHNKSPFFIETITVQVDYLKSGNQLVQTESFTTTLITPKGFKTILIPINTRGKKIKYRITNIQSDCLKPKQSEI